MSEVAAGRRSCVVTGAGRGIGREIARRMAARGDAVVVTDVDAAAAMATAEDVGAELGLALDVRDPAAHREVAARASALAPLAVWFNNAGVAVDADLVALTDEQVRRMVEVNLLGVAFGTRAALASFGPAGGDVVNTASLSGLGPVPGLSVYAATKAAVISLSMSAHLESPGGVRVHALCPDGVATAMLAEMDDHSTGARLVHSGGRILGPGEVAEAAVALVGSRRVVRTLPVNRGVQLRLGAVLPSAMSPLLRVLAAQGAWRARRRR